MTRKEQRARRMRIVSYYLQNHTLRECAVNFGVSFQRIRAIIHREAPEKMRPPYDTYFLTRTARTL